MGCARLSSVEYLPDFIGPAQVEITPTPCFECHVQQIRLISVASSYLMLVRALK